MVLDLGLPGMDGID
ncbi:hypothetical protein MKD33_04165, partial [Chromobacterium piscinae]